MGRGERGAATVQRGMAGNASAEKGRSYVADEEIRLIFLLGGRRPKDLADVWLGNSNVWPPLHRQTDCNMMSKTLYRAMHPSKCPYLV